MRIGETFEGLLAQGAMASLGALPWKRSLRAGEALGDLARRIAVRRSTAEANLARAFPERSPLERASILRDHYRELGRVVAEYARLGELARTPVGPVVAAVRGLEHLMRARAAGRGAILLSGHYGNVELLGAFLGQIHPVDLVVKPLENSVVEGLIHRERTRAGVGEIRGGAEVRNVYRSLRANRWVAMLGDQDARQHGVWVPFLGVPSRTAIGPARIALATGSPIIMGFVTRRDDLRLELDIDPPITVPDPRHPDAAQMITALQTARLEHWVRRRPEMWFWLHRRWKSSPAPEVASHRIEAVR